MDIDWAPDFVVRFAANMLVEAKVRATWFITHPSPVIEDLMGHRDLFELGIHPNFLPNSSHGESFRGVIRNCLELVPEATSIRTHSLIDSTPHLIDLMKYAPQIKRDSTIYLPHMPNIKPVEFFWEGSRLIRIPFFWEDNLEFERPNPCWKYENLGKSEGLRVFVFHPIHIFLNSATKSSYEEIKQKTSPLSDVTIRELENYVLPGEGTKSMFLDLISHVIEMKSGVRLKDICSSQTD